MKYAIHEILLRGVITVKCTKAYWLGFFFLSKLNKLTIFHSFILSNFNFCPLAWHFCSKANTIKLEKIQERTLRFIYEDYNSTYEELLHIVKVPFLQIRRMRTMALECFKILNIVLDILIL